jgi:hypothetical protein
MIRYSTGLRDALAGTNDLARALANGRLYIYSGGQPSDADTGADAFTNLLIFTASGAAYTPPVKSTGTLVLSGDGTGGSVDTVKVGGMAESLIPAAGVPWNTNLATTTNDLATAINAQRNSIDITAVSNGVDTVTLSTPYSLGAQGAGLTLVSTETAGVSLAVADTNFTGGTDAVNGLNLIYPPAAGVISKDSDTWQGTVLVSGNAGWFRFVAGGSSATGASTLDIRMDGTIATGGADMDVTTLALVLAATEVFSTFQLTVPAS